jgi:hypothetical protein
MTQALAVAAVVAFCWTIFKGGSAQAAIVDFLPPELRDGLTSRFAASEYAFRPSTPLPVQADFLHAAWGFCLATLFASLAFFSVPDVVPGCIALFLCLVGLVDAIRSQKAYRKSRRRVESQAAGER